MPEPKNVAIAGVGGIGGFVVKNLFDYGVNRKQYDFNAMNIDVYDDDVVDVKNCLHSNYTLKQLGKQKVTIMEEDYAINPIARFMTEKDFKKYDVILSCVDSMVFRKTLYNWSWEHPKKAFWIDGRVTSTSGVLLNSDIPRDVLERFIDESQERAGCLLAYEKEHDISHVMPQIIAGGMIQLFLNHLRGRQITEEKFIIL